MKALLYAIIIVFISSQSVMATNKKINSDTVTTPVPNKKVKKVKKTQVTHWFYKLLGQLKDYERHCKCLKSM